MKGSWKMIQVIGSSIPQPRCGFGFAFDSLSKKLVVHAGDVSHPPIGAATFDEWTISTDDWKWENKTIGAVSLGQKSKQPNARWGHSFASIGDGSCYLFGGSDAQKIRFGDFWKLNISANSWEEIPRLEARPSNRDLHSFTRIPDLQSFILIGGRPHDDAPTAVADVWMFDTKSNAWTSLPSRGHVPVLGLSGHVAVYVPSNKSIYCFGGWPSVINTFQKSRPAEEVFTSLRYDLSTGIWSRVADFPGGPRAGMIGELDQTEEGIVCAFGFNISNKSDNRDTWRYSVANDRWDQIDAVGPQGCVDARSVRINDGSMVIFGGEDSSRHVSDKLWRFSFE